MVGSAAEWISKPNVNSVFLNGSTTRNPNAKHQYGLRGFRKRCLRRSLRIKSDQRVTNAEIAQRTKKKISNTNYEVKKKRRKCLGHVFKMKKNKTKTCYLKMEPFTLPGQREVEKLSETKRRTI